MLEVLKESVTTNGANTANYKEIQLLDGEIGRIKRGKGRNQLASVKVMMIKRIITEWTEVLNATGENREFAIHSNQETSAVRISDKDCIFKDKEELFVGAAGTYKDVLIKHFLYPEGIPILKKSVWFFIDTNGLAADETCHVEIHYDYAYVNQILINRLSSKRL